MGPEEEDKDGGGDEQEQANTQGLDFPKKNYLLRQSMATTEGNLDSMKGPKFRFKFKFR